MSKSIETLKAEAQAILTSEQYEATRNMDIAELNRTYGKAYQSFNKELAQAYQNLLTVRMLGGK